MWPATGRRRCTAGAVTPHDRVRRETGRGRSPLEPATLVPLPERPPPRCGGADGRPGGGRHGGTVVVPLGVLVGGTLGGQGRGRQRGACGRTTMPSRGTGSRTASRSRRSSRVLPEVEPYPVSRYPLPNLRAVNFVVHGLLGLGGGLESAPGHAGEGAGGAVALTPRRGACHAGGGRAGRGEARLELTPGPVRSRRGIWQDDDVRVGRRMGRSHRGHCPSRAHRLERVHRAGRATGDLLTSHAHAGTDPRWLGPSDGSQAPGLRSARIASSPSSVPPPWCSCS